MDEYAKLWDDPTGWDLLVKDGGNDEKKDGQNDGNNDGQNDEDENGDADENKSGNEPFISDLSAWQPSIIGALLGFIYLGDWKDMDGLPPEATNLRSLPYHVHMAAQAWTLKLPLTVRKTAVSKINRATYQINNAIKTTLRSHPISPIGRFSIEEPIYQALDFLYKQEQIEVMRYLLPVRAAMSRLVDVVVPWLLKQPAFIPNFQTIWSQEPLYSRWAGDHWKFYQIGCLLPSWEDPPENYGESQVEEPHAKEPKAEVTQAKEPQAKVAKPGDAKAKDSKSKDVKAKDVKAKELKAKNPKVEDLKIEKLKIEELEDE
ncbi:uncharacterized protein DNG_00315 [Cephalotrichum gorgonifer]|uniref:Uncharacterized protein n=1 Tax=Cephalotrichum gorgonifer TaxID=2041049 RepID=A0AAE8MQL7_9PEZI|nr:uncharacterized protein DNG_00315 [Cephalotrichum gorgonifer]